MTARLGIKVVSSALSRRSTISAESRKHSDPDASSVAIGINRGGNDPQILTPEPFLRIPPFPSARLNRLAEAAAGPRADAAILAERLRTLKVGGNYWGAQPELPGNHLVVRSSAALGAATEAEPGRQIVLWDDLAVPGALSLNSTCDPWHVLADAAAFVAPAEDELHLVAALLGVRRYEWYGRDEELVECDGNPLDMLESLAACSFENPFTGATMNAIEATELCGFWRRLIDSNRGTEAGLGFAFWKQQHVAPLLWGGAEPFRFIRGAADAGQGRPLAVWRAKVPSTVVQALERRGNPLIEVEDGFLRSQGLGANCVPPISLTVDRLGAHFDPSRPSELELLLQNGDFPDALLERARTIRHLIVEEGIGKYGRGTEILDRPAGKRRHILVPGQVEDDRAVQEGGCGLASNLDLLERVRAGAPDAYILYKPHPDVVAGHRRGAIADGQCLRHADRIVGDVPIASLLAMVDEVHVNTSLAGFEALLRGKIVTTYGVPFYSGWGLTRDLGPVPERRTARRSLDELVAAALLVYPRYLDPVTGVPCPAETAVARLCANDVHDSLIVGVRRLQGKVMRQLRRLV